MNRLMQRLAISLPIIQSPMAGVSTPALAAAVTNAGGLGSIAVGNIDAAAARDSIAEVRQLTNGPFNVNIFCHRPAQRNLPKEASWIEHLTPEFQKFGSVPPQQLREIYRSYIDDIAMQQLLLAERPHVVSFHFGLPAKELIHALRARGTFTLATVTNNNEAMSAEEAGVDAVVAQGYEAGGHRGVFNPDANDDCLSTLELTLQIARITKLPIISAGGIMDAAGVNEAIKAGASAVQIGTAFLLCPEVSIDAGYRAAIQEASHRGTVMTRAISGRPARSLSNEFTRLGQSLTTEKIPEYPVAYDAGKALRDAAARAGNYDYGAHWAGSGASKCEPRSAAEIVTRLMKPSS